MRFLALATSDEAWFARQAEEDATRLAGAEAVRALELFEAGVIRDISFRTDRRDVVLFLEVPSDAAARDALASLPFVAAGAITFELIGLRPYDGWGTLTTRDPGGINEGRNASP